MGPFDQCAVCIAATPGCLIVPYRGNSYVFAFHLIMDGSVAKYFQDVIFYILTQIVRIGIQLGRSGEICQGQPGRPMIGRRNLYICPVIDHLIRKTLPVDQVYQMGSHIGYPFSLLLHIIEPGGTDQYIAGDFLEVVMYTLHDNGRLFGSSGLHFPKEFLTVHEHTDYCIEDIIPLCHHIIEQHVVCACAVEGRLEEVEASFIDSHRFIG